MSLAAARWPERDRAADLIDLYDTFLIDQFGTLHDGETAYPGVSDGLRALRAAGARVILLSNSGKRAAPSIARLARLGITEDQYDVSVTSGEVGWQMLHDGAVPGAAGARRCLLLERGESGALDGLEITRVTDAAAAQVVVIAGSEGDRRALESYEPLLGPAARVGVPCLCTNPDRHMVTPAGLFFGAARIGELYAELGGPVTWVGKPFAAMYDYVLADVADRARVVGVGDSLEHDVAGARQAGGGGWLVRRGILADADDATIAAECARLGVMPDGILRTV